jgi:hypothetical protein
MLENLAINRWLSVGVAIAILSLAALTWAAEQPQKARSTDPSKPASETVELFKAIQDGQIEVQLIPKNSTQCRVLVRNKTTQPLNVKLPDAFAGVPVLAQVGGRGTGGAGSRQGGNQGFGGGMGGMGGRGGMGGGMFNVKPEVVGQMNIPIVCLEHGKPDPRPKVKYEIRAIESFTGKPGVAELCQMLGTGQIDQRAAQAAAWNLNNDMSWQQLAAKRLRFASGLSRPYFQPQELQAAMRAAGIAVRQAEEAHRDKKTTTTKASQSGQ